MILIANPSSSLLADAPLNRRAGRSCNPRSLDRQAFPQTAIRRNRARSDFFLAGSAVCNGCSCRARASADIAGFADANGRRRQSHVRCASGCIGDRARSGTLLFRFGLRPLPWSEVDQSSGVSCYQTSRRESWMAMSLADSSLSSSATAWEGSPSPGTTTAHSRFSRNSRELMLHLASAGGVVAPI